MANFRVDLRNDDTTIASMMKEILDEFNIRGVKVYADNLFISVSMLRWCKEHGINLCGTTRSTFGFPKDLSFDGIQVCCFEP